MASSQPGFSSRHPIWFGLIIGAATILLGGIVVALNFSVQKLSGNISGDYSHSSFLGGKQFGMVRISGIILDAEKTVTWINDLRENRSVPGVIIRINSPGGAIAPSQEIFQAVKRLAAEKPVIVSMGSVAASGGYYAALPAHRILANAGTLTGSIGVKMELFQVNELLDKFGVNYEDLTSGPYKNAGSSFKTLSPEQRKYLQNLIDDMQEQFIEDVASHRKDLTFDEVKKLADGRAFTGKQAVQLGLVDSLGSQDDALEMLRVMCELSEVLPLLEMPKPATPFLAQLMQGLGAQIDPAALLQDNWERLLPKYLPPSWQSLPQ